MSHEFLSSNSNLLELGNLPDKWPSIEAELQDDPNLTLEQLTEDEQRKVAIRVVAAEHTDRYVAQISQALTEGDPDYIISEVVLSGFDSSARYDWDVASNVIAAGGNASWQERHLTRDRLGPVWDTVIDTPYFQNDRGDTQRGCRDSR